MESKECYYCNGDLKEFPVCYGVEKEIRMNNRRFWEPVGRMCETCFEKGEPISLMYMEEVV